MKKILISIFIVIGMINTVYGATPNIPITVPSAASSGYILVSTTTGRYIATTTDPLHVGSLYATSTATSTFLGGLDVGNNTGFSVSAGAPAGSLKVTTAGNVGIGTTTPGNKLTIYNTSKSAIGFSGASGSTYKWTMGMDVANGGRFSIASSTALGTTDRLVIDGNGNIGIGTTVPTALLMVQGDILVRRAGDYGGVIRGDNSNGGIGGALKIGVSNTAADQYIAFGTTPSGASGEATFTEKMRVLSSGNVGIGTTTPDTKLNIHSGSIGTDTNILTLSTSGMGSVGDELRIKFNVTAGAGYPLSYIGSSLDANGSDGYLALGSYFSGTATERMRITSTGNVGIGTTTPWGRLAITGSGATSATNAFVVADSTNAPRMVVQDGGNVGIGTTAPGRKLEVGNGISSSVVSTISILGLNFIGAANTSGKTIYIGADNTAGYIQGYDYANPGGINLTLQASGGNVGIGTTSPVSKLSVLGESAFAGGASVGIGYAGTAAPTGGMIIQGNVGIGTTTPQWPLTVYSATTPQLSLSAGAGVPQWTFRNAGGNLYLSTTTVAGTATTTSWGLKIDGVTGMTSFKVPKAQLSSGVSQTCTAANTAYPITFDWNDYINDGLTHSTTVNNATTTVNYEGRYEIIFSSIASTDSGSGHFGIWLNVNNMNVASSSTYVDLAAVGESVITAPLIYAFNAGDQFQLQMACDNAGSFLVATGAGALGGVMPASPSTIMTIKRLGAL